MADYRKPIKFIKRLEGDLSRAKTDSAYNSCQSGCTAKHKGVTASDWHTKRGVTHCTFDSWADKKGIPQNQRCDMFINMTDDTWADIWKTMFWDKAKADEIKSQAIAEYLVNGKWGNPSTANNFLEIALKQNGFSNADRNDIDSLVSSVNKIDSNAKELKVFNDMVDARVAWLHSLSGSSTNKGWFKRQESFRKRGKALIRSKRGSASKAFYSAYGLVDSDYRTFIGSEEEENNYNLNIRLVAGVILTGTLLYLGFKAINKK